MVDKMLKQEMEATKKINLQLDSINRITSIPLVEAGWTYAGEMYKRVKSSNPLVYWTLGTAENSINVAIESLPTTVPIIIGPINIIDKILCKSLDVVEQRVPSIYLPPQVMYWNTKQYVLNNKFVNPVLKRANSIKEFGNSVLASKYTGYAADKLDSALNVADKYVDKYLPDAVDQALDETDGFNNMNLQSPEEKAVHTMHHVDRLSRKFQRRLTRRTLAEAKALKVRSQEYIHVLLYVVELVATDPKLALQKAQELWGTLSEDEPENQARPTTLEQLIVMLTRESARRVVHLVNFTRSAVSNLPDTVTHTVHLASNQCLNLVDFLLKKTHLEGIKNVAISDAKFRAEKVAIMMEQLNSFTTIILERLANAIIGNQPETGKSLGKNNPIISTTLQLPSARNEPRSCYRHAQSIAINGT